MLFFLSVGLCVCVRFCAFVSVIWESMSFHKDNLAGFLARTSEAIVLGRCIDGDLDPGNQGGTQVGLLAHFSLDPSSGEGEVGQRA